MMQKKRLGIYGGTFAPPHIGHILAAESFVRELDLDELLIIPALIPPHKKYDGEATVSDRLAMSRLAFSDVPKAVVSDLEIKRKGKSYTYLTLEELADEGTELFLLCGTDMFLTLDKWRCAEKIFALANICYVRREMDAQTTEFIQKKCDEYKSKYSARVFEIKNSVVEISSSELRALLKSSECKDYLKPEVLEYIKSRGLYV